MNDLIKVIKENYLIDIISIEKNEESTVGNVYIINTKNNKYVLKIYDDLNHTKSMVSLHDSLSKQIYISEIIFNEANEGYTLLDNSKYIVVYSFLDGIQIGKLDKLDEDIVKKVALKVRQLHDLTSINNHNLSEVPFSKKYNLERKSLLHFDLTKGNIFYNKENDEIGFIDFDDAKYGYSIYDVSILIALLFFSKKRGVDKNNINLFIDTYYGSDITLKNKEIKYIKEIAIDWINYTLDNNDFNPSTEESFEVKKKLIEENIFSEKLIPFKECIGQKLYEMYQDIPKKEIGSNNELNGVSYEEFLEISNEYINEETNINKELNTTTKRYILVIDNIPVGEVGIRTTLNDYWINKGSQIYYKIRLSKRGKGYGNKILNLVLKEAKKLGFKRLRINCDNKNIASKKIILNNGGKVDIKDYKTKEGLSTSYLIDLK